VTASWGPCRHVAHLTSMLLLHPAPHHYMNQLLLFMLLLLHHMHHMTHLLLLLHPIHYRHHRHKHHIHLWREMGSRPAVSLQRMQKRRSRHGGRRRGYRGSLKAPARPVGLLLVSWITPSLRVRSRPSPTG